MKKRFGKVCFTSSLTFGLYPFSGNYSTPDTIGTAKSLEILASDGLSIYETHAQGTPTLISGSLIQVIQRPVLNIEEVHTQGTPTIISGSLIQVIQRPILTVDEVHTQGTPAIQSGSLTTVVIKHEVYDTDTVQTSTTLEITAS